MFRITSLSAVVVVSLIVTACSGSESSPTAPTASSGSPTKIMAIEGSLAFGDVVVGQSKDLTLTVRNTGTASLTLGDVSAPASIAPMMTATNASKVVAPGSSTSMTIRFSPTSAGSVSGMITIGADQTSGTNTIAMSGTGMNAPVARITIAGVITNATTGAPVGGATVTAVNVLTNTNARSTTDGNGYYSLANVGAGIVNLDWTASGFVSQAARETFAQDTRRDIRLTKAAPAAPAIEYRVSGTGSARSAGLTYANCSNGTAQEDDAQLPWSFTCSSIPTGQFLYISAQNNRNSGCVKTQIYKRGTLFKETESCGAYVIATTSGSY
jgi:Carboxypeptidase regulatory-like domain/HYDIN/CFA65/VesB-like, Ig-like domain